MSCRIRLSKRKKKIEKEEVYMKDMSKYDFDGNGLCFYDGKLIRGVIETKIK